MKWFESSGIEKLDSTSGPRVSDLDGAKRLNWEEMPALVHPLHGGKLPPERAEKKCHQLENIALAVIDLVNRRGDGENVTVVDFCSGGKDRRRRFPEVLTIDILKTQDNLATIAAAGGS